MIETFKTKLRWKIVNREIYDYKTLNAAIDNLCQCNDHKELRFKRNDGGRVFTCYQCTQCGKKLGNFVYHGNKPLGNIQPFNAQADDAIRELYSFGYDALRAQQNNEFWLAHAKATSSPHWRQLRAKVWARCRGICEGCGVSPAEHLHHQTYDRLGREMLFDVVAVCAHCHQTIHPHRELA